MFQADSFSLFQNQVQQKIVVRSGPARIENWTGTAFPAPNRPGLHPHLPSPYLRNDSAAACEVRLGGGREAELVAREAAVRGGDLAVRGGGLAAWHIFPDGFHRRQRRRRPSPSDVDAPCPLLAGRPCPLVLIEILARALFLKRRLGDA